VIDETDRMVEKGHFEELHQILELMNAEGNQQAKKRQNFVFSATLSLVHDAPDRFITKKSTAKKPAKLTAKEKLNEVGNCSLM